MCSSYYSMHFEASVEIFTHCTCYAQSTQSELNFYAACHTFLKVHIISSLYLNHSLSRCNLLETSGKQWKIMHSFSPNHIGRNKVVINGILLPKLFSPTVRKKCSSDREKLLKFKVEGLEFSKIQRSLEQFIQTVKGQSIFLLKFVFFEKSTKFDETSILLLTNKFMFIVSCYSFEHPVWLKIKRVLEQFS